MSIFNVSNFGTCQIVIDSNQIDTSRSFKLILKNGDALLGRVLHIDSLGVTFDINQADTAAVSWDEVSSIRLLRFSSIRRRSDWLENSYPYNYFLAPSAFMLRQKQAFYRNTLVVSNVLTCGVTDYLSIGGGYYPWLVHLKAGFQVSSKLRVSAQSSYIPYQGWGSLWISTGIGTITYGIPDRNISVGALLYWQKLSTEHDFRPGEVDFLPGLYSGINFRISRYVYLLAEGMIGSGYESINYTSYHSIIGFRVINDRISASIGLQPYVMFLPYVDLHFKFPATKVKIRRSVLYHLIHDGKEEP